MTQEKYNISKPLTEESLRKALDDLFKKKPDKEFVVYCHSVEAFKQFDEAMKKHLLNWKSEAGIYDEKGNKIS